MKKLKNIETFTEFNENIQSENMVDEKLLQFVQDCLKGTIYEYEPKNTKYTKKGYLRFRSSYDGSVLYVNKNKIILVVTSRFNFSASDEHKANYKINNKVDFLENLQSKYNYYRFFTSHYPEPGTTWSLKDGREIPKK